MKKPSQRESLNVLHSFPFFISFLSSFLASYALVSLPLSLPTLPAAAEGTAKRGRERFHRKNVAYSSSSFSSFHRRKNRLFFPPKHKQTRGAPTGRQRVTMYATTIDISILLYPIEQVWRSSGYIRVTK